MQADCQDCRQNVLDLGEYGYIVHDDVWQGATGGAEVDVLCVVCIERRLGRPLSSADFRTDVPLNFFFWSDSPLLLDRKQGLIPTGSAEEYIEQMLEEGGR